MTQNSQTPEFTNHLIHETSPYLLQHAHNPVDWHPWNTVSLDLAKQQDKPILLSIGYSACHWCHVMAHESFEDPETAHIMNELFINIKVDREERPDLDKIYQLAHQMLTERGGGWPLTMVLTPQDQAPYFAGTYFPKISRQGMPSFIEIMHRVEGFYRHRLHDVQKQNAAVLQLLKDISQPPAADARAIIDAVPLDQSRHQLGQIYDGLYSGFGDAPKFPHPTNVERLLRHWSMTVNTGRGDSAAFDMAVTTLKAMAMGGIYDQLGGGFCRYSVDQQWMIPHFEKMLYDNGPLLVLYAEAWQATGDDEFQRVALELGEWTMAEMQASEGGYYSSLDADSEGIEGKFYAWDKAEVKELLDTEQYEVFSQRYGLDHTANFDGLWHLYIAEDVSKIAERTGFSKPQIKEYLDSAKQSLFRARDQRIHPGRDEKVLTAWNGLMIKGMAAAGRRLQRKDFIDSAQQAVDFIRAHMWHQNRLLATYKDGKAHLMAYLDDYAFLLDGLLELLQCRWRQQDLTFAIDLADTLLNHYQDKNNGGFFFTADDHESLIQRPKVLMDEAIPAGNGIAAYALQRLGYLLGEQNYIDAAHNTLQAAWQNMLKTSYAHNALSLALEEYLFPLQIIVIRGALEQLTPWLELCQRDYAPRRMVVAIPVAAQGLPEALAIKVATDSVVAYVCSGTACQEPVSSLNQLGEVLGKLSSVQ